MNPRIPPWLVCGHEIYLSYLPLLYLSYALPVAVTFALINPPFQAPDEFNHFFRTVQISEGHLGASRSPERAAPLNNSSGGFISSSAITVACSPIFQSIPFHPEKDYDFAAVRRDHLFDLPWKDETDFVQFPNTAVYPFTNYIPAALGLSLSRALGQTVLVSFFIARLCNAFVGVMLCSLAIHWVTRGKVFFACLVSLPMTLFQFSTFSQDAMILAYAATVIALLNRLLDLPPTRDAFWRIVGILVLLVFIVSGRPPYFPFIFIAAFIISIRTKNIAIAGFICAAAFGAEALYLISIKPLGMTLGDHMDPGQQVATIWQHPVQFIQLMGTSVVVRIPDVCRQFIGVMGWLDCSLPDFFYITAGFLLVMAFLADFRLRDRALPSWSRVATLAFSVIAVMAIFAVLFMTFPLQDDAIAGEQGRYYIPIALMLTLAMGHEDFAWMSSPALSLARMVATRVPLFFIFITDIAACVVCWGRYHH